MLSVSAATLAGPVGVNGASWSYETLGDGSVIQTSTQRVVGKATYAAHKTVELATTFNSPDQDVVGTAKNYDALTSAGLIDYGGTGATYVGTVASESTNSYSTPEVILPATMKAGKTYTLFNTLTEVTMGEEGSSRTVTKLTRTLKLESARQSVTVPAGNFKAYVIDGIISSSAKTTINTTHGSKTTKSSNTENAKEYCVPNVGFVETAIGSGVTELTDFVGESPLAYSGKITGTLPETTLASGQKTKITEKLTLTNTGKTAIKGKVAISYYLSEFPFVATGEIPLNSSVNSTVNIAGGASDAFTLNISTIPASTPSGAYYVVAEVTDYNGSIRDFASKTTLFIDHE